MEEKLFKKKDLEKMCECITGLVLWQFYNDKRNGKAVRDEEYIKETVEFAVDCFWTNDLIKLMNKITQN